MWGLFMVILCSSPQIPVRSEPSDMQFSMMKTNDRTSVAESTVSVLNPGPNYFGNFVGYTVSFSGMVQNLH